jgi:MFS transporter, DHA3 family, macrolide efflux protein
MKTLASVQSQSLLKQRPAGLYGFSIIWIGQIISVLTSTMSHFALTIWLFQETGSATAMGLMQVFFLTPFLLISPFAGAMVDRYNRKLMMMVSDLAAVSATCGILVLQVTGQLQFWHLYIAAILNGLGNTFQWPAYSAAISTMLPKEHYGRANGMMSLIESGPGVFSPILAGALLPVIGLTGILLIDVATFTLAIGALLLVHIPQPPSSQEGRNARGSLKAEAAFGFQYIFARPNLLALLGIFFAGNLFSGIGWSLFTPLVLMRTGNNGSLFGIVQSAAAVGGVAGGLIMSPWGGPKRRVNGLLAAWFMSNLVGMTVFGFGRGLEVWIPSILLVTVAGPLVTGCSQAIWQAKVEPDLQGRVFAARQLIAWLTQPVTPILAGILADFVFEPGMQTEGNLIASLFVSWVGTGPGAGMSLLFIFSGLLAALTALAGYGIPLTRNIEKAIPDYDQKLTAPYTGSKSAEPSCS